MPNDEPFRLYPGSNDAERKINDSKVNKQDDLMMQIVCALILTVGVFTYFEQQRIGAKLENERLKQRITEQQQIIDAAPNASEIAEEVKKAIEQKQAAPVEAEKKPERQKPGLVRSKKPKRLSQGEDTLAFPQFRIEPAKGGK